ncbi:hypothetical protein MTO96_020430 [Rhipicephalus appendiculatus]
MSSLRLPPLAHRSPPRDHAWSADEADPRVVVARARWLSGGNQRSKQNTNGSPPGRSAGPARRGPRACPKQPRVLWPRHPGALHACSWPTSHRWIARR